MVTPGRRWIASLFFTADLPAAKMLRVCAMGGSRIRRPGCCGVILARVRSTPAPPRPRDKFPGPAGSKDGKPRPFPITCPPGQRLQSGSKRSGSSSDLYGCSLFCSLAQTEALLSQMPIGIVSAWRWWATEQALRLGRARPSSKRRDGEMGMRGIRILRVLGDCGARTRPPNRVSRRRQCSKGGPSGQRSCFRQLSP